MDNWRGPSPRGWGELLEHGLGQLVARTIPTRVGRTYPAHRPTCVTADHPHAGGENFAGGYPFQPFFGPSPRGWGELSGDDRSGELHRTIPTRVGRTSRRAWPDSIPPDHPHAGGENSTTVGVLVMKAGPSPRGWGERSRHSAGLVRRRTIPTRVGRTTPHLSSSAITADHPHAGGENPGITRVWLDNFEHFGRIRRVAFPRQSIVRPPTRGR